MAQNNDGASEPGTVRLFREVMGRARMGERERDDLTAALKGLLRRLADALGCPTENLAEMAEAAERMAGETKKARREASLAKSASTKAKEACLAAQAELRQAEQLVRRESSRADRCEHAIWTTAAYLGVLRQHSTIAVASAVLLEHVREVADRARSGRGDVLPDSGPQSLWREIAVALGPSAESLTPEGLVGAVRSLAREQRALVARLGGDQVDVEAPLPLAEVVNPDPPAPDPFESHSFDAAARR